MFDSNRLRRETAAGGSLCRDRRLARKPHFQLGMTRRFILPCLQGALEATSCHGGRTRIDGGASQDGAERRCGRQQCADMGCFSGHGRIRIFWVVERSALVDRTWRLLPVIAFWGMDAKYLRLERCYVKLYESVVKGLSVKPFDLDCRSQISSVDSVWKVATSWSVCSFYGCLLAMTVALLAILAT